MLVYIGIVFGVVESLIGGLRGKVIYNCYYSFLIFSLGLWIVYFKCIDKFKNNFSDFLVIFLN